MKKLTSTILAMLVIVGITTAQKFKIGLQAGANFSNIKGASLSNETKLNYHTGLFIDVDINKKIAIQPEILFSQTEGQTIGTGLTPNTSFKLNYLNIPILLKYKLGKVVSITVGPQFSTLLNSNNTLLADGGKAFKDGDLAMIGGIQLNFKYLKIYGRYNIGLQNINELTSSEKWKNEQIQIGVGFRF